MSQEFTLDDVLRGFWSRKFLAFAVFSVTVVTVGVATIVCPKSYTSDAKLFVRLGRENVVLDPTATLGQTGVAAAPLTREAEMNSIADMITSKQLLAAVVDRLGPQQILVRPKPTTDGHNVAASDEKSDEPGFVDGAIAWLKDIGVMNDVSARENAIIKLRKSIGAEVVEQTNVVSVSCESYSPGVAQEIVEELTSLYLREHTRLNRAEGGLDMLTAQTEQLRMELESAEGELRKHKDESGILSLTEDRFALLDRLARLRENLLKSRATEEALQAKIGNLKQKLESMDETTVIETRVGAGNQGADGMRQQLFELEMKSKELATALTKDHPRLLSVREQVAAVSEMLEQAEADRVEKVMGPNAVFDKTETELVLEEARSVSTKSEIAAIQKQIRQVEAEIETFTSNELLYSKLQRKVSVAEQDYRSSAQSLLQLEIDENLKQQQLSNISVAQPATLNPKPSFPNKLLNLVLGIVLGAVNALGLTTLLEFRNPVLTPTKLSLEFDGIPVMLENRTLNAAAPRRAARAKSWSTP